MSIKKINPAEQALRKRAKWKIKKGDNVKVITGNDKGKEGVVLAIYKMKMKILVEGVNIVSKSLKISEQNPSENYIKKENPIHLSNVKLLTNKEV